jgi:acetoin utilization protein AcuB
MNVEEIMTPDPMTVGRTSRVRDALHILQTLEIRHLPVVGENNALIGMISDRDLRSARVPYTIGEKSQPGGTDFDAPVLSIMSSDVVTIGPEADIQEAIDLMLDNKIGALPVIEDATGDLLGIVSYIDVLRRIRKALD